jgi:hypothetical protein
VQFNTYALGLLGTAQYNYDAHETNSCLTYPKGQSGNLEWSALWGGYPRLNCNYKLSFLPVIDHSSNDSGKCFLHLSLTLHVSFQFVGRLEPYNHKGGYRTSSSNRKKDGMRSNKSAIQHPSENESTSCFDGSLQNPTGGG